MSRPRKIVVLGMMTKIPVAGVVWQTLHYLVGLRRLGFDVYYVEAHARTPSMLMEREDDDGSALAAAFIDRTMRTFDLGDRWAYQAFHDDGRCYGLSDSALRSLYQSAELIVNLHGGTEPRPEHSETGRLVYIETDPVQLQVELHDHRQETIDFLEPHCAFFTFGENYGHSTCGVPVTSLFPFKPTRQPVVLDFWPERADTPNSSFTTVGNWRQHWRDVVLDGQLYSWSKHLEFERFLDLPARTGRRFELALSGCEDEDRARLEQTGWHVREALSFSAGIDEYRSYISTSFAEFTVAKGQNVHLCSGWFSDRSATYLAAGRPVVTQETGFSRVLPTGAGLFAFSTLDEAAAAVEQVCSDYPAARRAAAEVATECFRAEVVLGRLLAEVGIELSRGPSRESAQSTQLPPALPLTPLARRPIQLPEETVRAVLSRPVPFGQDDLEAPQASVVVVTHDNLVFTRFCLESILENTDRPPYELIVVDNASRDGTRSYLGTLARRFRHVRVLLNGENGGFPRACNEGLELARGEVLVILNNDTVVPPGWLARLTTHLLDPSVGLVGPVTNRIGNEAEIEAPYGTYEEFLGFAETRARERAGVVFEIPMPAMFCLALRRDAYERIGPLDERFGLGTLEDDDYALRALKAGYRLLCAEDTFVHHFGEATFGRLVPTGEYGALIGENRRRFEEKWGAAWKPYGRRTSSDYEALKERVKQTVSTRLPHGSAVLVVSRGDDELVSLEGHRGWHFPQAEDGIYAGHYPADSAEAITQLEALRKKGGDFLLLPRTSFWWLDRYAGLREHLEGRYPEVFRDDACVVFSLEGTAG